MPERQESGSVFASQALSNVEAAISNFAERRKDAIAYWVEYGSAGSELTDALEDLQDQQDRYLQQRERLLNGALASRPRRRMPSLVKIAKHQQLPERPACTRCGYEPSGVSTWRECDGRLERAHVIDRFCGGLDTTANLLPLCNPCHRSQPIFDPGDELKALAWLIPVRVAPVWSSPYIKAILAGALVWPPAFHATFIKGEQHHV